jgi:hypothetical protein
MSHIGAVYSSTERILYWHKAKRLSDAEIMELWARRSEFPSLTEKEKTFDDFEALGEFEPNLYVARGIMLKVLNSRP